MFAVTAGVEYVDPATRGQVTGGETLDQRPRSRPIAGQLFHPRGRPLLRRAGGAHQNRPQQEEKTGRGHVNSLA